MCPRELLAPFTPVGLDMSDHFPLAAFATHTILCMGTIPNASPFSSRLTHGHHISCSSTWPKGRIESDAIPIGFYDGGPGRNFSRELCHVLYTYDNDYWHIVRQSLVITSGEETFGTRSCHAVSWLPYNIHKLNINACPQVFEREKLKDNKHCALHCTMARFLRCKLTDRAIL